MVSLCGLHDFTLVLPAFHYGLTDIPLLFDYDLTWFAIVLQSFYYCISLVLQKLQVAFSGCPDKLHHVGKSATLFCYLYS